MHRLTLSEISVQNDVDVRAHQQRVFDDRESDSERVIGFTAELLYLEVPIEMIKWLNIIHNSVA